MKQGIALLATLALTAAIAGPAGADTHGKKIAFSNNYAGNSWRQAMLKSYGAVAKKAVTDPRSPLFIGIGIGPGG